MYCFTQLFKIFDQSFQNLNERIFNNFYMYFKIIIYTYKKFGC